MFPYEFIRNAFLASLLISILCPAVGTFLVLKRHSMMGDALSHSSFAGIAIGLLLGFNPLITSFIFTSICALFIEYLRNYYKKYSEIILVIVMTLSVGIGITLVSMGKTNANINTYLFGSILTVSTKDLYIMSILAVISLLILYSFFNKLMYITFDEEGAQIARINIKLINYTFSLLVGSTISLSIRIMGVLVISSIIALPTATALQLNYGFKKTFIYSIIFGFLDIVIGLLLSFYIDCAPGGTIAICSVIILLLVILVRRIQ